jgi:hypothetical protein
LICGEHSEHGKSTVKSCFKDISQYMNLCKRRTGSWRFRAFREDRILVAEEDIPSRNPRASLPAVILINVWVGVFENHLVDPYVLPPPHYVQNAAQEIPEGIRGILNRMWLSWTRRVVLKLAL